MMLAICVPHVGCGTPQAEQPDFEGHFRAIGILHGRFQGANQGRSPNSEKEFMEFIQREGTTLLDQFGIGDVEELFVSPRDEQPLVFLFATSPSHDRDRVVSHEKEGIGGKRVVVTALGGVELLSESEFEQRIR